MTPINFKANYIRPAIVQKKVNNTNKPCEVSFVELDTKNNNDYFAMKDVATSWGYNTYAYAAFLDMPEEDFDYDTDNKQHFYAITQQKRDFQKLNPDDVLGVMELKELSDSENKIEYLQVNPDQITGSDFKQYSHIGKAALDSVKTIYPQSSIILSSVPSAEKFYKQNGFVKLANSNSHFIFNA